jgi:hypothetical protein
MSIAGCGWSGAATCSGGVWSMVVIRVSLSRHPGWMLVPSG